MDLSTQLTLLVVCLLALSQAAPLSLDKRDTTNGQNSPTPQLMNDMYECWKEAGDMANPKSMETEPCNRSMKGDRSSHNSTIPAADTIEVFISSKVIVDPTTEIRHNGIAYQHIMEFTFDDVSSTSGDLHKTEVRIHHTAIMDTSSLGCNQLNLTLLKVNSQNEATLVDDLTVHMQHQGWAIFDKVNYDWRMKQDQVYRLAIAVSGDCSDVNLTKLGFGITEDPMLVVFTSQERMMTEVKLLPSSFDGWLVEERTKKTVQKRCSTVAKQGPCKLQTHRINNFTEVGIKNIIQPENLEINICSGSCAHPVAHNNRNTIYAALMAQISKDNEEVGDPSCVPISYKKVPLVYARKTSDGKIIHYVLFDAEAIATDCGCR